MKQYGTFRIQGNLVADPELTYNEHGKARARVRVAYTPSWRGAGGDFVEGKTSFQDVTVFDGAGAGNPEVIAENFRKGDAIYVEGDLRSRSYETEDGKKRKATDLIAYDFKPAAPGFVPANLRQDGDA